MKIGELATRTGASVRALRYYEEQGLITPGRTSTGQRVYDGDAVDRVLMLRRLFAAGLSSAVIARLLPCVDAPSAEVTADTIATMREQQARLDGQIDDMIRTRDQLAFLVACASQHLEQYQQSVPA